MENVYNLWASHRNAGNGFMGNRTVIGVCHICGANGPLTFEHIPPRAAFNKSPVIGQSIERLLAEHDPDKWHKLGGRKNQKGVGAYTLCRQCNSDTGAWYGNAYIEWAYQGLRCGRYSEKAPSLVFPFHIFPLRVLKTIICMFFSTSGEKFRTVHPDLVRFVLNREAHGLNPEIGVYAYYNMSGISRNSGFVGLVDFDRHDTRVFNEFSYPPWGYVLTVGSVPPDERLVDITSFANFRYHDWKHISLSIPILPVFTPFPGDYRNREQVLGQLGDAGNDGFI